MVKIAFVFGLVSTAFNFLSCLMKKRNNIILFNAISRVLVIIQYILLGAFSGAAIAVTAIMSTFIAQKKHTAFVSKNLVKIVLITSLMHIAVGLACAESLLGVLPIVGVLLHSGGFFVDKEKYIRLFLLIGQPFFFAYNFLSLAYASCVADVLAFSSVLVALFVYDIFPGLKKNNN